MTKAAINKTLKLNASGILAVEDDVICIEHPDTGEMIDLCMLLSDFLDKPVKISVAYDCDYDN